MLPSVLMKTTDGTERLQVSDTTICLLTTQDLIDKEKLERHQLEHFNGLAKLLRPDLAVEIISQADRPDFRVSRGGKLFGLDVAAFAFTARREAVNQFRSLKEHLINAYHRGRLRGCQGVHIVVAFGDPGTHPPRRLEQATVDELITAFERLTIDSDAWERAATPDWVMGRVPNPFPMGQTGKTSDGQVEWHVPGLMRVENNFTKICLFQIEHLYLHTVTKDDVKLRLNEIISKHDQPGQGIDELIIVAGGPDRFGEGVMDESVIANVFINHWKERIAPPKCIRRVILDNWQASQLAVLFER